MHVKPIIGDIETESPWKYTLVKKLAETESGLSDSFSSPRCYYTKFISVSHLSYQIQPNSIVSYSSISEKIIFHRITLFAGE
jgi:hypothetical protein